jgi:NADPH:quinone reductase-like Zn-dependent oxidoreductase
VLALVASPQSEEHIALREVPAPVPAPNQALVRVGAISINRGEMHRLAAAEDGARLGWDLAGVVEEPAADGTAPWAGARVVGFVLNSAWAQQVAVATNRLAELPADLALASAAALPVAGLTALRLLRLGGLLLGKRVLVTGASGGVGRFAVQLAALAGAEVTAVSGSAERAEGLIELGARHVAHGLTELQPDYHLILESVGGASLAEALRVVAAGGTIATFGNSSRQETTVNINVFYGRSGPMMIGFSLP